MPAFFNLISIALKSLGVPTNSTAYAKFQNVWAYTNIVLNGTQSWSVGSPTNSCSLWVMITPTNNFVGGGSSYSLPGYVLTNNQSTDANFAGKVISADEVRANQTFRSTTAVTILATTAGWGIRVDGSGILDMGNTFRFWDGGQPTLGSAASIALPNLSRGFEMTNNLTILDGYGSKFTGNAAGLTNLQSTILQTNFISGKVYNNSYGRAIVVSGKSSLAVAAVSGASDMSLRVDATPGNGGWTNTVSMTTLVTSIAMTYTNFIAIEVPTNANWTFTNLSSGAGNSATVVGGQIKFQ